MMGAVLETLSEHRCFGGMVGFYQHWSDACQCDMRFSAFVPAGHNTGPFPVLTYLAGLTCTEETVMIKGGALKAAAERGLMLVSPDTSPRGLTLPGEDNDWDFGSGAGFYLDATQPPWAIHYNMASYVTRDLQKALADFPGDPDRQGIFGHSMGGHGALTIGFKHPEIFKSISALAPITAPMQSPWGQKAFSNYLGPDRDSWRAYDATEIVKASKNAATRPEILIDQGLKDQFLESELCPHLFEQACVEAGQRLNLRRHEGYDHGYYFISTFMDDHLKHHANCLGI